MPQSLELKVAEENRTLLKNSLTLMHKDESIKSVYLEETKKILNDLVFEIRDKICSMSLAKFETKLKKRFFAKTPARTISCS